MPQGQAGKKITPTPTPTPAGGVPPLPALAMKGDEFEEQLPDGTKFKYYVPEDATQEQYDAIRSLAIGQAKLAKGQPLVPGAKPEILRPVDPEPVFPEDVTPPSVPMAQPEGAAPSGSGIEEVTPFQPIPPRAIPMPGFASPSPTPSPTPGASTPLPEGMESEAAEAEGTKTPGLLGGIDKSALLTGFGSQVLPSFFGGLAGFGANVAGDTLLNLLSPRLAAAAQASKLARAGTKILASPVGRNLVKMPAVLGAGAGTSMGVGAGQQAILPPAVQARMESERQAHPYEYALGEGLSAVAGGRPGVSLLGSPLGAVMSMGGDYMRQSADIKAGRKKAVDPAQIAIAGGTGAAFGGRGWFEGPPTAPIGAVDTPAPVAPEAPMVPLADKPTSPSDFPGIAINPNAKTGFPSDIPTRSSVGDRMPTTVVRPANPQDTVNQKAGTPIVQRGSLKTYSQMETGAGEVVTAPTTNKKPEGTGIKLTTQGQSTPEIAGETPTIKKVVVDPAAASRQRFEAATKTLPEAEFFAANPLGSEVVVGRSKFKSGDPVEYDLNYGKGSNPEARASDYLVGYDAETGDFYFKSGGTDARVYSINRKFVKNLTRAKGQPGYTPQAEGVTPAPPAPTPAPTPAPAAVPVTAEPAATTTPAAPVKPLEASDEEVLKQLQGLLMENAQTSKAIPPTEIADALGISTERLTNLLKMKAAGDTAKAILNPPKETAPAPAAIPRIPSVPAAAPEAVPPTTAAPVSAKPAVRTATPRATTPKTAGAKVSTTAATPPATTPLQAEVARITEPATGKVKPNVDPLQLSGPSETAYRHIRDELKVVAPASDGGENLQVNSEDMRKIIKGYVAPEMVDSVMNSVTSKLLREYGLPEDQWINKANPKEVIEIIGPPEYLRDSQGRGGVVVRVQDVSTGKQFYRTPNQIKAQYDLPPSPNTGGGRKKAGSKVPPTVSSQGRKGGATNPAPFPTATPSKGNGPGPDSMQMVIASPQRRTGRPYVGGRPDSYQTEQQYMDDIRSKIDWDKNPTGDIDVHRGPESGVVTIPIDDLPKFYKNFDEIVTTQPRLLDDYKKRIANEGFPDITDPTMPPDKLREVWETSFANPEYSAEPDAMMTAAYGNSSSLRQVQESMAFGANPNTPLDILERLFEANPNYLKDNPVLPLAFLEDPNFLKGNMRIRSSVRNMYSEGLLAPEIANNRRIRDIYGLDKLKPKEAGYSSTSGTIGMGLGGFQKAMENAGPPTKWGAGNTSTQTFRDVRAGKITPVPIKGAPANSAVMNDAAAKQRLLDTIKASKAKRLNVLELLRQRNTQKAAGLSEAFDRPLAPGETEGQRFASMSKEMQGSGDPNRWWIDSKMTPQDVEGILSDITSAKSLGGVRPIEGWALGHALNELVTNGTAFGKTEITTLRKLYGSEIADEASKIGSGGKVWNFLSNLSAAHRALRTSVDFGAPGRQTFLHSVNHPAEAARFAGNSAIMAKNPGVYKTWINAMQNTEVGKRAGAAGLDIPDTLNDAMRTGNDDNYNEHIFKSLSEAGLERAAQGMKQTPAQMASQVVGASERLHHAHLAQVRYTEFERLMKRFKKLGYDLDSEAGQTALRDAASYVNTMTGKTNVPNLGIVKHVIFAPSFTASRAVLASGPAYGLKLLKQNPELAKDFAKQMGVLTGTLMSVKMMADEARAQGYDVEYRFPNPLDEKSFADPKAWQLRIGKNWYEAGGMGKYLRAYGQILSGLTFDYQAKQYREMKGVAGYPREIKRQIFGSDSTPRYKVATGDKGTIKDIAGNIAEGSLSPLWSVGNVLDRGRDWQGNKIGISTPEDRKNTAAYLGKQLLPISGEQFLETLSDGGDDVAFRNLVNFFGGSARADKQLTGQIKPKSAPAGKAGGSLPKGFPEMPAPPP